MAKRRPGARGPSAGPKPPAQEERRGLRGPAEETVRAREARPREPAGYAEYDEGRVVTGRGRPRLPPDDESGG
jgi:hypothetical protein